MTTVNEITGDMIFSKSSASYRDNYDRIFAKTKAEPAVNPIVETKEQTKVNTIVLLDRMLEGKQIDNLTDNLIASLHLLSKDYKEYNYNVFITVTKKG